MLKPLKIVTPKGTKKLNSATSAERGTLATGLFTINASGNSIPPFYILPHKTFKPYMLYGAPPGSKGGTFPTGWMTGENFSIFMSHFKDHAKLTPDSPVLLLFDNHKYHITVESLNYAKENNIVLIIDNATLTSIDDVSSISKIIGPSNIAMITRMNSNVRVIFPESCL
ncbi:hypothetical protein WDU94_000557 [Cyamophila willieti]